MAIAETDYGAPGPDAVVVEDSVFHDTRRNRDVPYRLFRPAELQGRYPVVIFSHGLGGTVAAAAYLGRHLASHGYLAFHIQHPGSDQSIWQGATDYADIVRNASASLLDLRNAVNRYRDVPFVIDQLAMLDKGQGALAGHIDMDAIGMSGHSYGARSSLVAAGERIGLRARSFKDPRIKASMPLSPNRPERGPAPDVAYRDITIPILHVTGTEDASPLDPRVTYEARTEPFKLIPSTPQYLLILKDADHMVFGAVTTPLRPERPTDAVHQRLVSAYALAFWDAFLRGDQDARAWLDAGPQRKDDYIERFEVKE